MDQDLDITEVDPSLPAKGSGEKEDAEEKGDDEDHDGENIGEEDLHVRMVKKKNKKKKVVQISFKEENKSRNPGKGTKENMNEPDEETEGGAKIN